MLKRRVLLFVIAGYGLLALPLIFHTNASLQTEPEAQDVAVTTETTQNPQVLDDTISLELASSKEVLVDNTKEQAELQAILDDFASTSSAGAGIVVIDLETGARAELNPSKEFVSASLYKLFVAYVTLSDIDNGKITLSSTTKGMGVSVESCLNKMITVSDNPCGEALGGMYGWRALDTRLADEGYTNTILNNYHQSGSSFVYQKTTAEDVALLLTRLYNNELLSDESTSHFINLLKGQKVNDRLPTGLPDGTVIAHKTGELDGYRHDAGIVYGPRGEYLVVMLSGVWDSTTYANSTFTTLSKNLWDYFSNP